MIAEIIHGLRVIFGLFILFFVPGYAFTLALFPRKDELGLVERIGFAGALSIVADILVTPFHRFGFAHSNYRLEYICLFGRIYRNLFRSMEVRGSHPYEISGEIC